MPPLRSGRWRRRAAIRPEGLVDRQPQKAGAPVDDREGDQPDDEPEPRSGFAEQRPPAQAARVADIRNRILDAERRAAERREQDDRPDPVSFFDVPPEPPAPPPPPKAPEDPEDAAARQLELAETLLKSGKSAQPPVGYENSSRSIRRRRRPLGRRTCSTRCDDLGSRGPQGLHHFVERSLTDPVVPPIELTLTSE